MSKLIELLTKAMVLAVGTATVAGCSAAGDGASPFTRDDISAIEAAISYEQMFTVSPEEMTRQESEWGPGADPQACRTLVLSGNGPVLGDEVVSFDDYAKRGGSNGVADSMGWVTVRLFDSPDLAGAFADAIATAFGECSRWKRGDGLLVISASLGTSVVDGWTVISQKTDVGVSIEQFDSGELTDPFVEYYMVRENMLVGGQAAESGFEPALLVPVLNDALN